MDASWICWRLLDIGAYIFLAGSRIILLTKKFVLFYILFFAFLVFTRRPLLINKSEPLFLFILVLFELLSPKGLSSTEIVYWLSFVWAFLCANGKSIRLSKGPTILAPGLARVFSAKLIEACAFTHSKTQITELEKAVKAYKIEQKLRPQDTFHSRNIFVLFPDLNDFIGKDNNEWCLLAGLEEIEDANLPLYCYAGESLSIPYECSGAIREMNYSVLVLNSRDYEGKEKRDFFLCMDNRSLATLLDWYNYNKFMDGWDVDIDLEQKSYQTELKKCLNENQVSRETYKFISFRGNHQ